MHDIRITADPTMECMPKASPKTAAEKRDPQTGSVLKSKVVSAADSFLSARVSNQTVNAVVTTPVQASDARIAGSVSHE